MLSEVASERWRQDQRWGGPEHDDKHSHADWEDFIRDQLEQANFDQLNRWDAATRQAYRKRLVNIAALAVAAIQSMDRIAASQEAAAHG